MSLELDDRQRAMLKEMGVQVWLPTSPTVQVPAEQAPIARVSSAVRDNESADPAAPRQSAPGSNAQPTQTPAHASKPQQPAQMPPTSASDWQLPSLEALDWPALVQTAQTCTACALCSGRQNSSLCAPAPAWLAQATPGASLAHWMVVGDAPDEDEDAAASAFAGDSGVLLDNMLKALRLRRINPAVHNAGTALASAPTTSTTPQDAARSAYVTSVIKCRPPHGAIPSADDLQQCSAYLAREIALVQPRMILAMGRFANQLLLRETPALASQPLGKLRGSVRHFQGIPVVVTYHPKVLLRNSADKAKAWADLCLAADMLEASGP